MAGLLERFLGGKTRVKVVCELKSLACIGVADGSHEQTQSKGQHEDIQHGILPVALAFERITSRLTVKVDCGRSSPQTVSQPSPWRRLSTAIARICFRGGSLGEDIGIS